MDAKLIASILGNARSAPNNQFLASCPVPGHGQGNGDRSPSLSICDGDDGKLLFKCFGGCSQHSVLDCIRELGLLPEAEHVEPLSSIKPRINGHQAPSPGAPTPAPTLEAEYEYVDENGVTLFIKQRYRTSDAKGKTYKLLAVGADGRRVASMASARIVPYRLPDVITAIGRPQVLFIVEGEKAADALASLGLFVTSSHLGASSWPSAVTPYFVGASVVICPDNDKPGRSFCRLVAAALLPVCRALRVLELPGLGAKEDAFEWVASGGTRSQALALARDCPVLRSESELVFAADADADASLDADIVPALDELIISDELIPLRYNIEPWELIQDEPVDWLIENLLPRKSLIALYGPPASYKSFIALDIAHAIASGREWMGHQVSKPGAVLIIAGEGHGGIGARIKALRLHHGLGAGSESGRQAQIFVIRSQINLRSSKKDIGDLVLAIDALIEERQVKLDLIIVDTLARSFGGGNENNSEDMGAFITSLGAIQQRYVTGVMIIHHSGKDQEKGLRGHSSLLGAVDTELQIHRNETQMSGTIRVSKQKDGEDGREIGFKMVAVDIGTLRQLETVKSLAVEADEEAVQLARDARKKGAKGPAKDGLTGIPVEGLMVLNRLLKAEGVMETVGSERHKVILVSRWREEFAKMRVGRSEKTITNNMTDITRVLESAQKIGISGLKVWCIYDSVEVF